MLTLTEIGTSNSFPIGFSYPVLPVGLLRENGKYRIEAEASGQHDFTLLISDEQVRPVFTELDPTKTLVRWEWQIEEYAGEVLVTLLDGNEAVTDCLLDIAPHPKKLGSEAYRELLLDLQDKAEGLLFGTTPAHVHLQHEQADVPPMARFALLRTYLSTLERSFRVVEQAPHRSLVAEREERPLHKVRRVDTKSLRTALRRMPVLATIHNRANQCTAEVATLDVPRREHTFDTSPNRHVLSLLLRLSAICSDLHRRFESTLNQTSETEPDIRRRAQRWSELSGRYKKKIERLKRADFLTDVRPAKPDTAALLTIARHPAYSHFDQVARRILHPRIAIGEDADKLLSLRNTYDIYEYWCFFSVADAVQTALHDAVFATDITITPGQLLLHLKSGSKLTATHNDLKVTLTFQRAYGKKNNRAELFSISKTCIPDIVLEIDRGNERRTIIFDAKYRATWDSMHAALSDMHVYRDAIRNSADDSGIHAAFIVTPAHQPELDRYYTDEYRQQYHFGAFDLSPRHQEQMKVLVEAILRLISDW